ncbi:hypothetical protein C8J56DRAFT_1051050 [Mycena floridula]|nr:hypothetical protein C8J56DRAFT_1051050 [Mycena floridula]
MSTYFKGPINDKRRKADLVAIATDLSLASAAAKTNKALAALIQAHIDANPDDPRIIPLISYRPPIQPKGLLHGGRSSINKAAEDRMEDTAGPVEATGAHKKLLDNEVPVDPLPSFVRLSTKPIDTQGTAGTSDDGSESSVAGVEPDSDAVGDSPMPKGAPKTEEALLVFLNVQRLSSTGNADPEGSLELYLPVTKEMPLSQQDDGAYSLQLSQFLPVAINNISPMKERGGRIYRPGLNDPASYMPLGQVDAIASGNLPFALRAGPSNRYTLAQASDGNFSTTTGGTSQIPGPSMTPLVETLQIPETETHALVDASASIITSSQTVPTAMDDVGPAIVPPVATAPPPVPAQPPTVAVEFPPNGFHECIRDLLQWDAADMPRGKAMNAADALLRYRYLEKYTDKADVTFLRHKNGGWIISPTLHSTVYGGKTIRQEDLEKALGLGHTTASSARHAFAPKMTRHIPALADWVKKEENSKYADKFSSLNLTALKNYVDGKLKAVKDEAEKKEKPVKKSRGRKRQETPQISSGDDSPGACMYSPWYLGSVISVVLILSMSALSSAASGTLLLDLDLLEAVSGTESDLVLPLVAF